MVVIPVEMHRNSCRAKHFRSGFIHGCLTLRKILQLFVISVGPNHVVAPRSSANAKLRFLCCSSLSIHEGLSICMVLSNLSSSCQSGLKSCAISPPWPSGYDTWLPSVSLQVRVSAGSPKERVGLVAI